MFIARKSKDFFRLGLDDREVGALDLGSDCKTSGPKCYYRWDLTYNERPEEHCS